MTYAVYGFATCFYSLNTVFSLSHSGPTDLRAILYNPENCISVCNMEAVRRPFYILNGGVRWVWSLPALQGPLRRMGHWLSERSF